ncbi:MAG: hypothetical protein OER04_10385 [Cyclobacteriaceae bacterium]|nr:hypothetical protein [Cyclobacteriaceae bacterium]
MKSELQAGRVVWVYTIGCEGEVVRRVYQGPEAKYLVHIPEDDDQFVYREEELFVFGAQAEANIRKEWSERNTFKSMN